MSYQTEFPDFDPATMPTIPQGFDDVSWHNDTCPSFLNETAGLIIFVDYADAAKREYAETTRFSLKVWDIGTTDFSIAETDDWNVILQHVTASEFADLLLAEIGAEKFALVLHRNATAEYGEGVCASHDFCDANMVMAEAVAPYLGEVDADNEAHASFWSAAWAIAKAEYLTSK